MRSSFAAPLVLGFFAAIACGGNDDQSQVGGAAAGNNIDTGTAGNGLSFGGGTNGSGNGTGTGGGEAFDPNSACATSAADGEPIPVDLYFMVDITGSMNCPVPDKAGRACVVNPGRPPKGTETRWTVVSAALKAFFADPQNADLGVGIRFFPTNNNVCNAATYAKPTVEIGPLSSTGALISGEIAMQDPDGQTPTVPSLSAAVKHAATWATQNPTHRVAVVYATDGYPQGCDDNNTIANAAQIAKQAFDAAQSIPTYVLGVGPNLTDLNSIAANGGTNKAFLVDTSQNAATQLTAALASIRTSSVLDCTYTIPAPPSGQTLEPGKVNVNYTNSAGKVTKVLQDPPNTPCAKGSGWQYSADGKQIDLCGALCDSVKADHGGKLQVLFGCATEIGNPPK